MLLRPLPHRCLSLFVLVLAAVPATQPPQDASTAATRSRLSPWVLEIWNDPGFQKRFTESYLAETDIEPGLVTAERETMRQVMELHAGDQLDAAAELLQNARREDASAVLDFALGNIRFQQDRLDDAELAYRAAVQKFPKFRRAWGNLGQVHFRRGDFTSAGDAFTKVVELGGVDGLTFGLLGVCHARSGNDVAAESAFRMATMLAPSTLDWKMGLAESFYRQQRFADAAALFGTLIAAQPERADFWLAQGEAYARMGQARKAAENFELADQLGGATVASLSNLGDIYANEELYPLAVDAYLRALQRPDANVDRVLRTAKFMAASGALAETGELLAGIEQLRGEQLTPEARKDLLKLRARVAAASGAGEQEAQILEQIVALDPLDGDALIMLGQYHERAGDTEKAVFLFERAAGIEKFAADASVRHAQLLVRQRRFAEAVPLLRRAQSLQPRDNIQEYLVQVERAAQQAR